MTNKAELSPQIHTADETSLKYMLNLAGPMIIATISFTVMQFTDRFMVSRLGTEALAAILPAQIMSFVPSSFAMGAITAVTIFVSQNSGRNRNKECSEYVWQAIYMGLAYFILVVLIFWPAAPFIFKTLGHEPAVAQMEVTYLRIILYAQVLAVFIWCSSQFFMGIHRPVITMYAALCSQVVNVVFNYLLIFGKFGFPQMGIAGAAWGTFIGIVVGMTIRMWVFLGKGINDEYGSRRLAGLDFAKMKSLLAVGLPAGIELMLNVALWGVIMFALVGRFGNEALAASSAVFSCTQAAIMPIVGFKIALTAAVGKVIGAGRKNSAVRQTSLCLKIAFIYMGLIGLCFFVFRNSIMRFWSADEKVIETGAKILICAAIYQLFHAARTIYSGSLRGAGDTLWTAAASVLGALIVLGGGGLLFVKFFPQLGALGPWIAATASIMVVGLANRQRFKSNRWKDIDLFKEVVNVPMKNGPRIQ